MAMEYDGHVKAQQAGQGVGLLMFLQSPWAAFAWFVWRLDFFYQEGFVNPAQFEGSAFWSLLAVLLTWCALLPTLLAVPLIAKRGRTTAPEWNGKVALFLHVLLPASLIFSTLFLWAFPHQWGLLPWKGSFYDDLWKIGPFIGLFSFAGVPTVMIFVTLMRLLANPEFASEQPRAVTRHPLETPPPVSPSTVLRVTGTEGATVHFAVDVEHLGHDAWVGLYRAGQSDQDHGERWMWVRDTKEGKGALQHAANGPLSLRLFKDGGYARMTAVNVEPTPMEAASEAPNPRFWDA